jgi:hypothetical protein
LPLGFVVFGAGFAARLRPVSFQGKGKRRSRFPVGNDRQKGKGKYNSRSFALLRMTNPGLEDKAGSG